MDGSVSKEKQHRRRGIAVVCNNAQNLLSASFLLQRFDYEVATASTAAQALELISAKLPAMVITDLVLPGMSGIDLFHLLRQDDRTSSLPVVFMVPVSDAASERRCLGMGAAGCITKPVQAEELYRIVQEIIERSPRINIRVDTRLAVTVDNLLLDCDDGLCNVDLSEDGMYVPTSQPLPRNRQITVQLQLNDRQIRAVGCVLFSRTTGSWASGRPGMGLKFIDMTPQDRAFIRDFIHNEITRGISLRPSTWT
jgi:CheY-like chemotaxis protein